MSPQEREQNREVAAQFAVATAAAQGLPPVVTDPVTLGKLAELIRGKLPQDAKKPPKRSRTQGAPRSSQETTPAVSEDRPCHQTARVRKARDER